MVGFKRARTLIGLFLAGWTVNAAKGFCSCSIHRARAPTGLSAISDESLSFSRRNAALIASSTTCSRRQALAGVAITSAATAAFFGSESASAGTPKLDSSGNLFAPKSEMLRGGSESTRGIPIKREKRLQAGETLQTVYNTRFIAYLSRFLLNFDPSARAWWVKQGFGDGWDELSLQETDQAERVFSEFAESVEIGLANYFVGPYGSYGSVSAAVAGVSAAAAIPSKRPAKQKGIVDSLLRKGATMKKSTTAPTDGWELSKQGVLNLYALLKARYTTVTAKKQLAVLFSFITPPLQPTIEIAALLGEADNATISKIDVVRPVVANEAESRTSSRRGGGYSLEDIPLLTINCPPALGDDYACAELIPIMKVTSRVLKIKVVDGGAGYDSPPFVSVSQSGISRLCQATALLDRNGSIESILVLDPGYGYGGRNNVPPIVTIEAPRGKRVGRRAKAVAELEFGIAGAKLYRGGNGYVQTEPPKIQVTPPVTDPDWFIAVQEQPEMRMVPFEQTEFLRVKVSEMRSADGNTVFSIAGNPDRRPVDDNLLERLTRDPLEMLPSSVRPQRIRNTLTEAEFYSIPALEKVPQFVAVMEERYRAYDPVFGGVGVGPVQIGATQLSASEYARLALSGAVCTVIVRTVLNPLELIKTKQQLVNDDELFEHARARKAKSTDNTGIEARTIDAAAPTDALSDRSSGNDGLGSIRQQTMVAVREETQTATVVKQPETKIGTIDLVMSLIELRGPLALFQSADITFLASIAFGSFGFGATELFRRSFTAFFFTEGDSGGGSELILLLAAGIATVVTAAVASPFELLRVRSMGQLEPQKWTRVLKEFIEKGSDEDGTSGDADLDFTKLKPRDLLPLWAGFNPTLSRELPFAIAKFLTFDVLASTIINFLNSQLGQGAIPVQVGVGPIGLGISALSGAVAGVAGAIVSHPADLILTKTSSGGKPKQKAVNGESIDAARDSKDWKGVVKELVGRDGGVANLFIGLGARSTFFFLVIGLQFFLYDYVKNLFQVGSEDLNLVLDVFFAVRAGLVTPTN
ncbi:hypothetical protein MPSEU_000940400 [Mayamaea pseudoterrestris]|nr:hypothetical protein MPSEU_000940400 [Mayamaea pseudoterrestris]